MAELDRTKSGGGRRSRPARIAPSAGAPAHQAGEQRRHKERTSTLVARHLQTVHSRVVKSVNDSLTSAAELVDPGESKQDGAGQSNAVARTWQHAVYGYSRSVPELSAAQIYVGNCFSRVQLVPGKRLPSGEVEEAMKGKEVVDGVKKDLVTEAADIISNLRAGSGGQAELLRSSGEKIFLVGEMWLLPLEGPAGLTWEALSTSELSKKDDGWVINNGPGFDPEPVEKGVVPLRVWRPDVQFRRMASSSVRACMEVLEELVILTRLVRSAAISRIALAGILAIADQFDQGLGEDDEDGQESEAQNPLAVDMINIGSKAIDDPASAASWMPYILQGDIDCIDRGLKHIQLQSDGAEQIVKRQEAVERLARGIDLPVEAVMGHQQTTFANAMQVSQDVFNLHLAPALKLLCDALTVGYLWPEMAKRRNISAQQIKTKGYPDDIMSVAVHFDAAKLISKPDRSKDILLAYRGDASQTAIANAELREAVGLDADGGPDDEETAKRIDGIRLTKIRETIAAPATDAAVPISEAEQNGTRPGESEAAKQVDARGGTPGANGSQPPAPAPTGAEQPPAGAAPADQQQAATARLGDRIAAAAELTIERCCEAVGAKLKNYIKTKPAYDAMRQAVEDVPNANVARILGPDVAQRVLGKTDPVAAELAVFQRTVRRWAIEAKLSGPDAIAGRAMDFVATRVRLQMFAESLASEEPSEYLSLVSRG